MKIVNKRLGINDEYKIVKEYTADEKPTEKMKEVAENLRKRFDVCSFVARGSVVHTSCGRCGDYVVWVLPYRTNRLVVVTGKVK